MVNSAEWNQLGISVSIGFFFIMEMLLFLCVALMWDFLWHPVQVRTDSVVFNLMDDGEYWNRRPLFFFMTSLFLFVSCADVAGFCSPQCMLTEPLFYSVRDFHRTPLILDFEGILLWLQPVCDFPQHEHFQHVKDPLDLGFTRISLPQIT